MWYICGRCFKSYDEPKPTCFNIVEEGICQGAIVEVETIMELMREIGNKAVDETEAA